MSSEEFTAQGAVQIAQRALRRVEELEARVDGLEAENDELRSELKAARKSTELHDRVQRASALKPAERAAVLIQTLYNEAMAKKERSTASGIPTASMEAKEAVKTLGGSVNRTLMYGENGVFQKAVELVDDEEVLRYKKEDRAAQQNSRLILDLEAGELPETAEGFRLKGGAE